MRWLKRCSKGYANHKGCAEQFLEVYILSSEALMSIHHSPPDVAITKLLSALLPQVRLGLDDIRAPLGCP